MKTREQAGVEHRYPSRRSVVYSDRGMVCTSQTLAAQAGLEMLKKGGNAVDAALATVIALTVLEPVSNGLGSDAFAIVWSAEEQKLFGLNGSGWAPRLLTLDAMRRAGCRSMPDRGWASVTVPGAPSAWAELHRRFGRLPFPHLFEPAIGYAEDGFPVQPVTSFLWSGEASAFASYRDQPAFAPLFETFLEGGAPRPGERRRFPLQAKTLRKLAETGCESFYRGTIATAIDAFSRRTGGYLRRGDLEPYRAEWVEPVHASYRGWDVCEIPPNGHGMVALMTLNILQQLGAPAGREDVETVHRQLEAMKLGFTDGMQYITDPRCMRMDVSYLLSSQYAAQRAAEIGETALLPKPVDPDCGGTVYLCTADQEGNMVSFIQSNFQGFGSGICVPEYGISFNDRASSFRLDPQAANVLAPGKKPYHTIIPGFLMKDGRPVGPFGVMGGYMQPQGHVQLLMNLIDFDLDVQEALDAPRWQWMGGRKILLEEGFGPDMAAALRDRGHEIKVVRNFTRFGRGQIILRGEDGVLRGATEPRADGVVAAW
jgi:gamma-glutamyltranspeptidase / glutathione hydrolase